MAFRRTNGTQIRDTPAAADHFWAEAYSNEQRFHPYSTLMLKRSTATGMKEARSIYSESFFSNDLENFQEQIQHANTTCAAGKPTLLHNKPHS